MRERVEAAAFALRTADRVGEPGKLRLRESRRELEREWLATSEALRSQGQTALAEQTRRFVRTLPPARTERNGSWQDWLNRSDGSLHPGRWRGLGEGRRAGLQQ
jgi:hypothetical protein